VRAEQTSDRCDGCGFLAATFARPPACCKRPSKSPILSPCRCPSPATSWLCPSCSGWLGLDSGRGHAVLDRDLAPTFSSPVTFVAASRVSSQRSCPFCTRSSCPSLPEPACHLIRLGSASARVGNAARQPASSKRDSFIVPPCATRIPFGCARCEGTDPSWSQKRSRTRINNWTVADRNVNVGTRLKKRKESMNRTQSRRA